MGGWIIYFVANLNIVILECEMNDFLNEFDVRLCS